ncbi:collagen binding domain-containing protein [Promicromonospora sp. NPDC057488]|uniref:MSCRAMM family protein n=1 Tax=Promicromonospora sp. NPDC057488 TaxID=3346147 RepID=UPI0036716AEA
MKRTPGGLGALAAAVLVAVCAVVPVMSASAATTAGWAQWDPLSGSAGDWSTSVRLPAKGFPEATVTSDSRGGVGVISGASSWLAAATPPGEVYGSSRDQQYLNLRPQADRPSSPSTTTYTFERPTPPGGWAFVLGDIDADRAVVTALGVDGRELAGAELGFQGGFNYCSGAGSPSCTGDPADVPTWDPATGELLGNPDANDTSGAAGWFQPTTPIKSLTVQFFQRSGFPVYQTWFASLARDISGTVNLVDGAGAPQGVLPGATLTLFGPDGAELATTTSDESGQYAFPGYAAADGYAVELTTLPEADDDHPYGLVPYGERTVEDVDLGDADATGVDLAARDVAPVAVSGTVLTDDGEPVRGATVTLTPVGGGVPLTAVTSSTGEYLIDHVGWDAENDRPQEYTFALSDLPEGFAVGSAPDPVTVRVGQEEASTGNDFVVRAPASLSGTVTVGGEPVAGVVVTREGPGGTVSTTTGADGTYRFDEVPAGDHTVRVTVPDGYRADGPATRDVTVGADDVTDVDFGLSHRGAIGGTVADDAGEPVAGTTVTVTGPDGPVTLVTDDVGGYFVGDLPPGDYTIVVTLPEGYTAEVVERSVTITSAGEDLLQEDFALVNGPVEPQGQPVGGTVTHAGGAPVPGTRVTVTDADGTPVAATKADDDGAWRTRLPAGTYTAVVHPGDGYVVDGESRITFEVADAEVTGLDFVLGNATQAPSPGPGTDPSADPDPDPAEPGDLAATGATVGSVTLAAGVLVVAGVAMVRGSRRRS